MEASRWRIFSALDARPPEGQGKLLLLISEHVPTEMEKPVASFR
jgi:hypothetical protein